MTRTALIVAHGQPSDPEPAEAELAKLAARVFDLLPGWQISSATLASPDSLKNAARDVDRPLVFPFFMADGWFIRSLLPTRLTEAGLSGARVLRPFGLLRGTTSLAARMTSAAAAAWGEDETTVILAAHGSGRSPYPAEAARAIETALRETTRFREIRTGFIEQDPSLTEAAKDARDKALCLPLFVARWGHVRNDIPDALNAAHFTGRLLEPIGCHVETPGIIANSLVEAESDRAGCR